MRKKLKPRIMLLAFCIMFFTTGAAFASNIPKLNIDSRPVYSKCDVAGVISSVNKDYSSTEKSYSEKDIIACGVVNNIEKNQKTLMITFSGKDVKVTTDKKNETSQLKSGDSVTVYGKFKFESAKKKTISIEADHLVKESISLASDYYIYSGKQYKDSDSSSVTLADGRISYKIPNSWLTTEVSEDNYSKIFNSTITNDHTGKCYYINRVNGGKEPEIFCVFYFNNNKFLEKSSNSDKTHDIEKAIITNVCPEEETKWNNPSTWKIVFPTEKSTTSNGVKLDHYVGNYDNYRVEFAFAKVDGTNANDSGGICVMMHLYNDDSIKPDDVLYVLNSLSINSK